MKKSTPKFAVLKHTKEYYIKFFLFGVLFFFMITYAVVNQDTLGERIDALRSASSFFATTAVYETFDLKSPIPIFPEENKDTYEIEIEIYEQINQIRRENGLRELKWDPMISAFARTHSENMILGGFFNHTDPFGQGPNERAENFGLRTHLLVDGQEFNGVGENIGITPRGKVANYGILISNEDIASATVLGWMLSDPHRETILTEDYFFTGISVVYDGYRYYYITQNFQ